MKAWRSCAGQAHARGGEFVLFESSFIAALIAGEIERHGDVADEEHLGGVSSGELNEGVLAGKRVAAFGSDDGVGDSIDASHGDESGLGMESFSRVHVGHDLVAWLD